MGDDGRTFISCIVGEPCNVGWRASVHDAFCRWRRDGRWDRGGWLFRCCVANNGRDCRKLGDFANVGWLDCGWILVADQVQDYLYA